MTKPKPAVGWTVLIVDDAPDNREALADILALNGATVFTASNGQEALDLLSTVTPTIILTDLSMPQLDGWHLLTAIRGLPALTGVPVVALTAHALPTDKEGALAAGFDGYITKPYDVDAMIAELQRLVSSP